MPDKTNHLKQLLHFPHLFNPFDTAIKSFSGGDQNKLFRFNAPVGKLELHRDPYVNSMLWNTIYSALLVGGGAALTALIANKIAEKKTRKAVNAGVESQLSATRPTIVSDPNLQDLSTYTALPESDMERVKALLDQEVPAKLKKNADDPEPPAENGWANVAKKMMMLVPFATAIAAGAGGGYLANEFEKNSLKKKLKKELIRIRNAQAYVDRKVLEEQGLVTPMKQELPKLASVEKKAGKNWFETVISAPAQLYTAAGLGGGAIAYALLRNRDKNLATVKYLQKMQFGKNEMQGSPQLSILDLPATTAEMLKLPGDTKQETFDDSDKKEPTKKALENKARKALTDKLAEKVEIIDVEPIDKAGIVAPVKKDALFL